MQYKKNIRNTGFSLIEIMIVVAIIGVLAAVSFPSYRDYVIRSHRTEAMEELTNIMNQQQRYVLRQRRYTADLTDLGYPDPLQTAGQRYTVTAAACGGSIVRCVQITAAPVAGTTQAADGAIVLNSRGDKTWNGQQGWNHR